MADQYLQRTKVGLRQLPNSHCQYIARTPKGDAFKTVWIPVNASKRVIRDQSQAILYLYYSRHLAQGDSSEQPAKMSSNIDTTALVEPRRIRIPSTPSNVKTATWMTNSNSLAPFASIGKPTCGYYFSRKTDNKKRRTGIPPSNTVKWRSRSSASN